MVDIIQKLKRVEELNVKQLKSIMTNDEILNLAKSGIIPHYILMHPVTKEKNYYFIHNEVIDWYVNNNMERCNGNFNSQLMFIYQDKDLYNPDIGEVPSELIRINNVKKLPLETITTTSGVYFLYDGNKLVYIGQSIDIRGRIMTHVREERKNFDKVFFINCHVNQLIEIETALIKYFNPYYNQLTAKDKNGIPFFRSRAKPNEKEYSIINKILNADCVTVNQ